MIRHLFKIIWNERKANAWIILEFFVVFTVLWFCIDYLSFSSKLFSESMGYDINHVYTLSFSEDDTTDDYSHDAKYETINTILNRVKHYPGVESVSISKGSMPFSYWGMASSYKINADSVYVNLMKREVTPAFFEVFKIPFIQGKALEDDPHHHLKQVVAGAARDGKYGPYPDEKFEVTDVHTITKDSSDYTVVGCIGPMKSYLENPFHSNVFFALSKQDTRMKDVEINIRISPQADTGFKERFAKEMEELLSINPFIFQGAIPVKERIEQGKKWFVEENLRSVVAISIFLVANIFLGIIGTFWSRIQSRRSETGLRIALGSSKKKVKLMMIYETLIMLFISSILATYLCLNLGQTEFLESFGIPTADRMMVGAGGEQDVINYLLTYLLLALISGFAVWYPARLSTRMSPADALREE